MTCRIRPVVTSFGVRLGRRRTDPERTPASASRALVPVTSGLQRDANPSLGRPLAPFLAQLIATKQQSPQTRTRRRGGVDEALESYSHEDAPLRGRLSRSV